VKIPEVKMYLTSYAYNHGYKLGQISRFTHHFDKGVMNIDTYDKQLMDCLMSRASGSEPMLVTFDPGMSDLEEARYLLKTGKNEESIAKALDIIERLQNK